MCILFASSHLCIVCCVLCVSRFVYVEYDVHVLCACCVVVSSVHFVHGVLCIVCVFVSSVCIV